MMDQKNAPSQKFVNMKNQILHASQPREGIFDICSHQCCIFTLFVRTSNCSHCFDSGNKCPKRGTGTSEDIYFINLGEAT